MQQRSNSTFYTATTTTTTTAGLLEYTTPATPGDAELCNPWADMARFGEIWEAEIQLKLPVSLCCGNSTAEKPMGLD